MSMKNDVVFSIFGMGVGLLLLLMPKRAQAKVDSTSSEEPDLPGARTVTMPAGSTWKVVGYSDPGVRLKPDQLATVLESMGHQMLKFLTTGESGFGYTVKVGPSGLVLKVPSYSPPIHVTTVEQAG